MVRRRVEQVDPKCTKIHFFKSAYWGRCLKTLLNFKDPLTGGVSPGCFPLTFFFFLQLFSGQRQTDRYIYIHIKTKHFPSKPRRKKIQSFAGFPISTHAPAQRFMCLPGGLPLLKTRIQNVLRRGNFQIDLGRHCNRQCFVNVHVQISAYSDSKKMCCQNTAHVFDIYRQKCENITFQRVSSKNRPSCTNPKCKSFQN